MNLVNPSSAGSYADPVLTNLVHDQSGHGGWFAPVIVSVKRVAKDSVRWGKIDSQALLGNFFETLRTPGSRYNLIPRPSLAWALSAIQEDAVRSEYTEEDVVNSVSRLEPAMSAAMKILNVLQFATEARAQALAHAATNTAAASAAWGGAAGTIQADIGSAKLKVLQLSGLAANYIVVPPSKLTGALASTELKNLQVFTHADLLTNGGVPSTLFGLRLFSPGTRTDTAPTGVFTPAFLWDTDAEAYVGYSPTLNGGSWDGEGQPFGIQFENQINGSAFEIKTRRDANWEENLINIVYGNVRRSLPEVYNQESMFRITGI